MLRHLRATSAAAAPQRRARLGGLAAPAKRGKRISHWPPTHRVKLGLNHWLRQKLAIILSLFSMQIETFIQIDSYI